MLELNLPSVDEVSVEEGTWVEYEAGIKFLIARDKSPSYVAALQKMYRQKKRAIDNMTMTNQEADKMMARIQAQHILKGWEGILNDGEEFKYSVENAERLLTSSAYQEVREWIMEQSSNIENYRAETLKA